MKVLFKCFVLYVFFSLPSLEMWVNGFLGTMVRLAIFFACYRGHLGPSGPKSRGREAPGVEKVEKESKKSPKSPKIVNFGLFFDFFDPRAGEATGTHFGTFFGLWARRAQMTPVAGEEDRKTRPTFLLHTSDVEYCWDQNYRGSGRMFPGMNS